MCTTTFWPGTDGYRLGMNRDERRTRVHALPPELESFPEVSVVGPSEPGGGRWISLNSAGVTYFLVNWYSVPHAPVAGPMSRGAIVSELRKIGDLAAATRCFEAFSLARFLPFRAGAVFAVERVLVEWSWDSRTLQVRHLPWAPTAWISSGADEARAQRVRQASIERYAGRHSSAEPGFVGDLHSSHEPVAGADSICMHREEATTVSFTEIAWKNGVGGTLSYWDGSPCLRNAMEPGVVHTVVAEEKSASN